MSIDSVESAGVGSRVSVSWTGPDEFRDIIRLVAIGSDGAISLKYTEQGNPVELIMPADQGDYELQYLSHELDQILVSRPIKATDVQVTLEAPDEAGVGELVNVVLEGPNENNDLIQVAEIGGRWTDTTPARRRNPAIVQMPTKPGDYELRSWIQR